MRHIPKIAQMLRSVIDAMLLQLILQPFELLFAFVPNPLLRWLSDFFDQRVTECPLQGQNIAFGLV